MCGEVWGGRCGRYLIGVRGELGEVCGEVWGRCGGGMRKLGGRKWEDQLPHLLIAQLATY